ncbi:bromodomain protein, putative [Plasmodium malariae]|uniref:Bromodomain protein, putative n=1 Tax=Plasmodium malariae TaxID=5858 RepID=A0A1A8WQD8_PLAMA|nr:bromodomain protein, putative [Plasmodium malariae]
MTEEGSSQQEQTDLPLQGGMRNGKRKFLGNEKICISFKRKRRTTKIVCKQFQMHSEDSSSTPEDDVLSRGTVLKDGKEVVAQPLYEVGVEVEQPHEVKVWTKLCPEEGIIRDVPDKEVNNVGSGIGMLEVAGNSSSSVVRVCENDSREGAVDVNNWEEFICKQENGTVYVGDKENEWSSGRVDLGRDDEVLEILGKLGGSVSTEKEAVAEGVEVIEVVEAEKGTTSKVVEAEKGTTSEVVEAERGITSKVVEAERGATSDVAEAEESADSLEDSVLFNISNKDMYNFHILFEKDKKLKDEFFLKNHISEKTLLLNLHMEYSSLLDQSFFPVSDTYFYNYYFDDHFFFFIRSSHMLNLFIKVQRKNILLSQEIYFEFLKIHLMNKCKTNTDIEFYLCNYSASSEDTLVHFLEKCFKHLNAQSSNGSSLRLYDAANEISFLLSQIRMYIREVDILLRIDIDKTTHTTTIKCACKSGI